MREPTIDWEDRMFGCPDCSIRKFPVIPENLATWAWADPVCQCGKLPQETMEAAASQLGSRGYGIAASDRDFRLSLGIAP